MTKLRAVPPAAVDVGKLRRVVAVGAYGAGKTTLARELGDALDLPVHHLDSLRWLPDWQLVPLPEWRELLEELVRTGDWIIDGNFEHTLDIRLRRAQTVLFLDVPLPVSLWRIARRRLARADRPDLAPGCVESLNLRFLRLLVDYRRRVRPQLLELIESHAEGRQIVMLQNRRDAEALLAAVRSGRPGSPGTAVAESEPKPRADVSPGPPEPAAVGEGGTGRRDGYA